MKKSAQKHFPKLGNLHSLYFFLRSSQLVKNQFESELVELKNVYQGGKGQLVEGKYVKFDVPGEDCFTVVDSCLSFNLSAYFVCSLCISGVAARGRGGAFPRLSNVNKQSCELERIPQLYCKAMTLWHDNASKSGPQENMLAMHCHTDAPINPVVSVLSWHKLVEEHL